MLKKIASNTISQILSKVFTAIISIFLISSLTKYLSPEMYWQYNKIYNYLSIFTFLADLWLYAISVREISKNKENISKVSKIIWNVMSLRFILWIFIIFLSIAVALFIPWYNTIVSLVSIFIISIFSLFSLMNSSVISLMQAFMKVEFSALTFVLWKMANLALILWVIFIIFPIWKTINFDLAFILIMTSGLLWIMLNFFLNFYYANKIAKIKFLFDFEYMKYLFKISLPNWIALFLSVVYFKIDVLIISLLEIPSKADISIALYSLPVKIIEVLMVIWVFFLNSILPVLSENFKKNNIKKIKIILENSFKFLFSFWFLVVVLWILFWKDIILTIATKDYLDNSIHQYNSYDAMFWIILVLLFNFISSLFSYIFISSKNEKKLVYINLIVTFINIIWNFILIPKYSFLWAAIMTFVSQIVLFLLGFYFSRKIIKFDFDFLFMLKVIILNLILFFVWNYFLQNFSFWSIWNILIYWSLIFFIYTIFMFFLNREIFLKVRNKNLV